MELASNASSPSLGTHTMPPEMRISWCPSYVAVSLQIQPGESPDVGTVSDVGAGVEQRGHLLRVAGRDRETHGAPPLMTADGVHVGAALDQEPDDVQPCPRAGDGIHQGRLPRVPVADVDADALVEFASLAGHIAILRMVVNQHGRSGAMGPSVIE